MYQHNLIDNVGKVVCVGRNYLEHIHELNNPVPKTPILFMKPSTSLISIAEPIVLPNHESSCHHEVEIAILIGKRIDRSSSDIASAILGFGIALDLTLRDLQTQLKEKGHPWEVSKAFDGSCPISPFISQQEFTDLENISFSLSVNGEIRQQGNSKMMIYGIIDLITYMCKFFTLLPGDIVLTGTPKGVAPLKSKDTLKLKLGTQYIFETTVL